MANKEIDDLIEIGSLNNNDYLHIKDSNGIDVRISVGNLKTALGVTDATSVAKGVTRYATLSEANTGTSQNTATTPEGVASYVSGQISDEPTALAGTNNELLMTPYLVKQLVDQIISTRFTVDAGVFKMDLNNDGSGDT